MRASGFFISAFVGWFVCLVGLRIDLNLSFLFYETEANFLFARLFGADVGAERIPGLVRRSP